MAFPVKPRHSTTLMLAVRTQLTNQQSLPSVGYKLLMLQRSSKMKFMPNRYVFPGGVCEATDFSPDWLDLIGHKAPLMSMIKPSMINIPFYSTYADRLPKEGLPACIGFRICAIRETFEESGVLLVTLLNDGDDPGRSGDLGRKTLSHDEIKSWRGKVHSDSSFFIKLCRDLHCVPDIWSLHEWSNWITPAQNLHRRFNTMFYITFLDSEPQMSHDGTEVTSSTWVNPADGLESRLRNMLDIAPPQFYEMSRLCRFSTIDDLKAFVLSLEGVDVGEPVAIQSSDGDSIYFFPGDDLYEQVKRDTYEHYENTMKTIPESDLKRSLPLLIMPQSTDDFLVKTKHTTNRLAINFKKRVYVVNCTAKPKYNMPSPLSTFTAKL